MSGESRLLSTHVDTERTGLHNPLTVAAHNGKLPRREDELHSLLLARQQMNALKSLE